MHGRRDVQMPREMRMNVRHFAAAALVAALAVAAVGATGASGGKLRQYPDRLASWSTRSPAGPTSSPSANSQFKNQNPGWDVDVQYQEWGTYRAKLDAALAGGGVPDVIEIGNTQTTQYMVAGAFQDLTRKRQVPEREHLALGARGGGRYGGKTYAVPYYAGSRVDHVPHRPLQAGEREGADEPRRVHGDREEARREEQGQDLLARSTLRGRTGTSP